MGVSKKILVIDDSRTLLTWTKDVLEAAGYEVVTAENVFAARSLAGEAPDLMMMDVQFSQAFHEGVAATRSIKRDESMRHIPIVLYSALPVEELIELADESGANGYISKSDDGDTIIQQVTYYLSVCELEAAEREQAN